MLSNKPYLIRAFYDWIVDSRCTPFLVVNANFPRCTVPVDYVENGEIILNISPEAIRDFKITPTAVEFRASFSGVVHLIFAPIKAILAIYAQENQQGMFFEEEGEEQNAPCLDSPHLEGRTLSLTNKLSEKRPHLKLVE